MVLSRLPFAVTRALFMRELKHVQGPMENYGLPKPDHKLGQAHPTISADLLARIGHGRITPKPNIARHRGDRVDFDDGTSAADRHDRVVHGLPHHLPLPAAAR